jgi:hypothetical protein
MFDSKDEMFHSPKYVVVRAKPFMLVCIVQW